MDEMLAALKRQYQIEQLVTEYNMGWDQRDHARVVSCFTPDGVFVDAMGNAHVGAEGITAFVENSFAIFGAMRHMTMNHTLTPTEEGWEHRCYMLFAGKINTSSPDHTSGWYRDDVVEVDGNLRFKTRRVYLDGGE